MDTFNPAQVYSSIDRGGRYAYNKQPEIAHWNLMVLAQSLRPLLHVEQEQAVNLARGALEAFSIQYHHDYLSGMAGKLGLGQSTLGDEVLIGDLLGLMATHELDFTRTLRQLSDPQQHAQLNDACEPWMAKWLERCSNNDAQQPDYALMQANNPVCIPRNHLIEAAIDAATDDNDFSAFHELVDVLAQPYDAQYIGTKFSQPPAVDEIVKHTFCGT
jgi:uncharacterized protein YdiU (UPF0061 family)